MKRYSIILAIIALLLSACCPTVSVNPLSPPTGLDKRLSGVWKYDSKEGDDVYLHIGEKSEKTMLALSVEHKRNGKLDVIEIPFFVTKTSENNYLNVKLSDLERAVSEGKDGYIFIKYVFVDDNTLLFFQLDRELVISAIQAKKLAGTITYRNRTIPEQTKNDAAESDKIIDCVTIIETPKNMITFFESDKNDTYFSNAIKFQRVK